MDQRERKTSEGRNIRQDNTLNDRPTGRKPGNSAGQRPRAAGHTGRSQRSGGTNARRRSKRARRRRRNLIIRMFIFILLIIVAVSSLFLWKKYGSSKKRYDLKEYYGIQKQEDLAVIVNDQVIGKLDQYKPGGKMYDGIPYIEYSVVRDYVNDRFYWDFNENVLLYTLPKGNVSVGVGNKDYTVIKEKKTEKYVILKTEGPTAYIALPFIQEYTNMNSHVFKSEDAGIPTRVVINSDWREHTISTVKKNTAVRYQGGVKSPILSDVEKGDKVRILEKEGKWTKVRTKDGFIGYMKAKNLKKSVKEIEDSAFKEPEYTNISMDRTVNMAWHNVDNEVANSYVLEDIARTKGLTVIAPTWFSIADTEGTLNSISSPDYVNYAHQSGLDVWGVLRDFHGGINSYDETYEVLSYTSKRESLINQVIAEALQTGLDGINLDFELVSQEAGEHYIQFVRELSVKCRQNGLVFSVSDFVPMPYNQHYNLKEQGIMADYVIIMGYDEHTSESYEAGSVSSYDYVKKGIEDALQVVPKEKLISGIALFTRLWTETPKTEEELASDKGTEAEQYPMKVTSKALGMQEAEELLQSLGATPQWDEKTRQNYAEWGTEEEKYKIWLEDEKSLEEKLKLVKENNLAGVASWCIGWEKQDIWDLILQYVN